MADLHGILDALDEAVGAAASVLDVESVESAARVADQARSRFGFLGESLVIALVGGTGSGKSSLLNALADEPVAQTGVLRPTTQTALAWMPFEPEPGLVRLLDRLGVTDRQAHHLDIPVCLLDMPDVDSVLGAHRDEVERLLPQVDAVVWVVDPEKYNDRIIHRDFLAPLAAYQSQFAFVLNQVDRVFEADVPVLVDDLTRQLNTDGFDEPVVLVTAAAPTVGGPVGIDGVWEHVAGLIEDKQLVASKLVADVAGAARDLEAAADLTSPLEWDSLWEQTRAEVGSALADAAVDSTVEAEIVSVGRARALAAHPLGVFGAFRQRRLGRALGLDNRLPQQLRAWSARSGAATALRKLEELVGTLAGRLRGRQGRLIAEQFDSGWLQEQISAVMDRTLRTVDVDVSRASRIGLLGWLAVVAAAVGGIWWRAMPPERGEWPWPWIVLGSGLLVLVVTRRLIKVLADRHAARAVAAIRGDTVAGTVDNLDRLVAAPIRRELRGRAELRAALTAVGLAVAERTP